MRQKLRLLHYPVRTEVSYLDWVTRFLKFHRDVAGVTLFLTDLGWVARIYDLLESSRQQFPGLPFVHGLPVGALDSYR